MKKQDEGELYRKKPKEIQCWDWDVIYGKNIYCYIKNNNKLVKYIFNKMRRHMRRTAKHNLKLITNTAMEDYREEVLDRLNYMLEELESDHWIDEVNELVKELNEAKNIETISRIDYNSTEIERQAGLDLY